MNDGYIAAQRHYDRMEPEDGDWWEEQLLEQREYDENDVDTLRTLLETIAMTGQLKNLAEGLLADKITAARVMECYRTATDPMVFDEVTKYIR